MVVVSYQVTHFASRWSIATSHTIFAVLRPQSFILEQYNRHLDNTGLMLTRHSID